MNRYFTIVFLLLFGISPNMFAQQHVLINYSLEEGLPQSSVITIYQDTDRNIWLGTQGGVCKFNGNSFETFDTRNGLAGNHIDVIFQDSKQRLWFGHRYKGISLMDKDQTLSIPISEKQIDVIKEDYFGNIWVGTDGKGLFILPQDSIPQAENFIRLSGRAELPGLEISDIHFTAKDQVLASTKKGLCLIYFDESFTNFEITNINTENSNIPFDNISSMLAGRNNDLWILGDKGVARALSIENLSDSEFERFPFTREMFSVYRHNMVMDKSGTIWGTYDYGVFRIQDGKLLPHFSGPGFKSFLTEKILIDYEENVWFGTAGLGVFKYPGDKFMLFDEESGLSNNVVIFIMEDNSGRKWIATEDKISIFDNGKYTYLTEKNGLPDNGVDVIFEDSRGTIWIGYYTEGPLVKHNPHKNTFRYITKDDGLLTNSVLTINEDKEGNIWFASLGYGVSRYTYPRNGIPEKFTTFTQEDGLCGNNFWIIHKDQVGNLWFGSDKSGLTMYDGHRFITYNEKDGLTNLSPGAITHDSYNNLWIASIGGGVYKFDGEYFTNYSISEGLSSDSPFSIICDNNDNIWVGTNSGIDKFEHGSKTFKHYGKEEGFLGIENNQNAILKDRNGIIWFGTMNGIVRFDPSKDIENKLPPDIHINNIKLFFSDFNYRQHSNEFDPLSRLPQNMVFNYKQNHLTFEFNGVTHIAPAKVEYQYKLQNFDDDWNPVTKSNIATYTNIPPGEYRFLVKSKNGDGYWNEQPLEFSFSVLPPLWQKAWFKIVMGVFLAGLIYFIFWLRFRNIKEQKLKLQKLVEEKTKELKNEALERKSAQLKAEQADKLKTAFLANMSHEIRTPVNAIVGFADLLKDRNLKEADKKVYINYITRGGKTLLTLINDIIDISKIEAGQVTIGKESCNVNVLLSELFYTFHELIRKKEKPNLELRIANRQENENLALFTDPYRLKQILSNLISNAIKFTSKGYIEFGYKIENPSEIIFYVKDTGIGIPSDKQDIIFQRFRQVEESYTRNFEGTGLGLSISKKLTTLMNGEMWVESVSGEGSVFYFTIPLETSEEVKKSLITQDMNYNEVLAGKSILVVEDEDSNYLLIETMLNQDNLKITRAKDGISAVELFSNNGHHFDIVLMDIKIPGLNGYEATGEIKKIDSKIPVIAQTAYAMSGEKDKCIKAGCDDYIAKPYNKKELMTVIQKNLIDCHSFQ